MKLLQHHSSRVVAVGSLLGTLLLGSAVVHAQTCPSYPIALPAQLLLNVPTNSVITDIFNGDQLNNFGWLTWTGDASDSTLLTSLTAPGDSTNYVNPDNPADQEINVGDWVSGRSSSSVRTSLCPCSTTSVAREALWLTMSPASRMCNSSTTACLR
jgi:hypothetical protein